MGAARTRWALACAALALQLLRSPGPAAASQLSIKDLAFGIGSVASLYCSRWDTYLSLWWRPDIDGVVLVDDITPAAQACHDRHVKDFPRLLIATAPAPPAGFGAWVGVGGERIIWSQIVLLKRLYPNKRCARHHVSLWPTL